MVDGVGLMSAATTPTHAVPAIHSAIRYKFKSVNINHFVQCVCVCAEQNVDERWTWIRQWQTIENRQKEPLSEALVFAVQFLYCSQLLFIFHYPRHPIPHYRSQ